MIQPKPQSLTPGTDALVLQKAPLALAIPSPAANSPQIIINIPTGESKQDFAEILHGVASILWPLVTALVIVLFRREIVSLLHRIRKGKAFGAEAEFDRDLEALDREAKKAKEQAESVPASDAGDASPDAATSENANAQHSSNIDDMRANVLAEAARSPRLGLMLLSAEIDKLARRIAASTGHSGRNSLRQQLDLWQTELPTHTSAAYRLFSDIRNRIVHGRNADDVDILSAIDSGLTLYDALISIPIEQNLVFHPGVEIFGDSGATKRLEGYGLIIETTHNGKKSLRIFPTTKTYFQKGMRLTWEWDMSRVWGEAWYRDPETGEVKFGWSSSAEFVGRDLDQI